MPSGGPRILILSSFFTQGHGGTPESVLLLARELAQAGITSDVFCDKGLVRDAQLRRELPTTDDLESFSIQKPGIASYAALFVAGSWNKRAPLIVLRAARKGI